MVKYSNLSIVSIVYKWFLSWILFFNIAQQSSSFLIITSAPVCEWKEEEKNGEVERAEHEVWTEKGWGREMQSRGEGVMGRRRYWGVGEREEENREWAYAWKRLKRKCHHLLNYGESVMWELNPFSSIPENKDDTFQLWFFLKIGINVVDFDIYHIKCLTIF